MSGCVVVGNENRVLNCKVLQACDPARCATAADLLGTGQDPWVIQADPRRWMTDSVAMPQPQMSRALNTMTILSQEDIFNCSNTVREKAYNRRKTNIQDVLTKQD